MKIGNIFVGKPKIGIALGAGAAKGWAHIGVLKALEEHGITPEIVAGTSAGGVVGAFYAAGALRELEESIQKFRSLKDTLLYLDFGLGSGGIVKGKRWWKKFLETHLPVRQFSELKKAFGVVAVDLVTMQEIYITEGELLPAIRATIAVPGFFSPYEYKHYRFVDGGLLNPVPVDLARMLGADIVIAVDLDSEPDNETPDSVREILLRSIEIMRHRIRLDNYDISKPDIVIKPKLRGISFLDYHKHKLAIDEGYRAAMEVIEIIKKLVSRRFFLRKTIASGHAKVVESIQKDVVPND